MTISASIALLAALAAGLLGGVVFASPRSESWSFDASVAETVSWLSTQATATSVGAFLIIALYAVWARFGPTRSTAPMWAIAGVSIIVLAFVKVAIPEAASVAVLTALHILKCCAAGVLIGSVAGAVRGSRAGWVALSTGLFGGFLVIASQGTIDRLRATFVPGRPFSSGLFGEPAWWLLGIAVVAVAVAAVVTELSTVLTRLSTSVAVRLVAFAAVVAVVGRVGAEAIVRAEPGAPSTVFSIVAVLVFVIVVDVVAARWDRSDARVILAALACTAVAVSVWSALTTTGSDRLVLGAAGAVGLVLGAALAAKAPRLWLGLILLLVVPIVLSIVRTNVVMVGAVAVAGLAIALTLGSLRIPADDDGTHDDSARAFALLIPGTALALTAAQSVLGLDDPLAELLDTSPEAVAPPTEGLALDGLQGFGVSFEAPGPFDLTSGQRTETLLMLAVVLYSSARMMLRRK